MVFILHITGSDPVALQIPATTEKACETAKAKLLGDVKEAGLGRAVAICLDTGRAV
ncbi:hypothetical protein [Desertibaculum subflavum]|uniref:hypothetical protein n=1 Tax=Desertibaculum subflavum TaxID=2268458 RepID=UPI0013C43199